MNIPKEARGFPPFSSPEYSSLHSALIHCIDTVKNLDVPAMENEATFKITIQEKRMDLDGAA